MLSALRGAAHYMSGSFPISFARGAESSLYPLGDSNPLGIPVQAIWFVAVVVAGIVVLRYTRFGYWLFATGGNELAARESGIPTRRIRFVAFVLVGLSCGLIAVLQAAWLKAATPTHRPRLRAAGHRRSADRRDRAHRRRRKHLRHAGRDRDFGHGDQRAGP